MPLTIDRGPVQSARIALAASRRTLIDKLYAMELATSGLADAQRQNADGTGGLSDAQGTFDAANQAFQDARADQTAKIAALQTALATWLPDGTASADDVGRLFGTEPIVLFPVRVETRFDAGFLKVRVFPDEIFLNTHETALTQVELDAAQSYYDQLNTTGDERPLWRDLVARFGVQRSAYILRQTLPVFGAAGLSNSSSYSLSSSACGGTLSGGHEEELFFPQDTQLRASSWTRPGEAVLPDRWLVVTYAGGTSRVTPGSRVLEPLAMTADPKLQDADLTVVDGTYKIDDNIRWTVDFDRAVSVGMAISVPLQGTEATTGYDRVIVVGVKSSMSELDTSRMLELLFDAHHYTRGVAMLRQGTPTNNTEGHPTPFPPKENAGQTSFIIERQPAPLDRQFAHHCMPPTSNGHELAMALGVPSGVFSNVERGYLTDTFDARLMNRALWPGTIGYFMQHMMASIFSATQIAHTRSYFEQFVLARGPAPAFRIGAVPYGVLPVASLRNWQARSFGDPDDPTLAGVENGLLGPLQSLLDVWLDGVGQVPRIRAGQSNPDLDVATVLSTSPSAREFRVRYGLTPSVEWLFYYFFGWDFSETLARLDQQSQTTFGRIGFPSWRPPIGRTVFFNQQALFTGDVVAAELSEDQALPGLNFITGIFNASVSDLNAGNVAGKPATANLLYTMLRHSVMAEYARVSAEIATFAWVEFFIFNVPSLLGTIPFIIPLVLSINNAVLRAQANAMLNAISSLAFQSSAELERMFGDTMGLTSYRLDAWINAFAYRRLDDMRRAQIANGSRLAPKGDYLGGYGWLEDVRPLAHPTETVPGVGVVETQVGNGGFIHTPSMTHATASAILRNGNLSFRNDNPSVYGIDLSSRRVRAGRDLFEGVRNGQPVGALLGYQLERGLHEGHPGVSGLDALRFKLRGLFPLVANKSGEDSGQPAEAIAARNVVDGSLLLRAFKAGQIAFGSGGLPAVGTSQYSALVAELNALDQMYDAAADLLTAESVFQLARGNIDAAVPTMNNVVEGNHPPESIITRSARGGAGITHRVALVFPSNARPTLPAGWPAAATPRAAAEPVLDAWLGQLAGDPRNVSATVSYLDANGATTGSAVVKLSDLGLRPLDATALAAVVAKPNQASMLDREIIAAALADPARRPATPPAAFSVSYAVTSGRSFPDVMEVLGSAAAVLGAGRELQLKDLVPPVEADAASQEPEAEPVGGANAIAFYQRGQTARGALIGARDGIAAATPATVRAALVQAAFFVPLSAFPDPRVADSALGDAAQAVLNELNRRLDSLPDPLTPDAAVAATASDALIAHGKQTLAGVFGADFRALPDLDPPRAPEMQLSLGARGTLLAGDDAAPDRYLQQIVRSRPRLARWRKLNMYARVYGLDRPNVGVVQLPFVPDEKWLGLGFDVPPNDPERLANLPAEGRTAILLLNYAGALDPTVSWVGIVVDDWIEVIPHQVEETGIALHYISPQAQAPQAVLVATPSTGAGNWTFDDLLSTLEQTMDLMKVRAVNQDNLDVGQALPMTVVPSNPSVLSTLSTIFLGLNIGVDTVGLI